MFVGSDCHLQSSAFEALEELGGEAALGVVGGRTSRS
jgi:hypothetical protein